MCCRGWRLTKPQQLREYVDKMSTHGERWRNAVNMYS